MKFEDPCARDFLGNNPIHNPNPMGKIKQTVKE